MTLIDLINSLGTMVSEGKLNHGTNWVEFKQDGVRWKLEMDYYRELNSLRLQNLEDYEEYKLMESEWRPLYDRPWALTIEQKDRKNVLREKMEKLSSKYNRRDLCCHEYQGREMSMDQVRACEKLIEQLKRSNTMRWFSVATKGWTNITE